ncbi:efflux RND transporter periplasmic adaptor subunit [Fulvivirga sp. 29W222]|uniref:Efflux RND transporter periplasmic adaptor subunit n=1 Tax=Fulvivirga marina TaxID=2494733 RepID=A0A937FYB6_9BACT|nr:efflux RND transporter periplasmic adaptor subunit [Fulvivirga marina]MBL6448375.1 efflux RND transporter periplasmic adaptor subunit [Fulvivirga marina]
MKKLKYLIIIPAIGLLASCGSHDEATVQEIAPVKVQVATAKAVKDARVITVSGKIEAGNSANISTRMMGNVTGVMVKPGDKVKQGDLLLTISSTDLQAKKAQVTSSITQAKSAYDNAEKDYNRFKILYEKGSASEKEFENMGTRLDMAKAGLEAARQMQKEVEAQFAYTNIRAPFSGVVANTFVKAGDIANPGMPLVAVEGTSKYEATVMVPESQIAQVQVGAETQVLVKSSNQTIAGKVKEVSPSAKNTGGQFLVKIDLPKTQNVLPGMFVNADIEAKNTDVINTSPLVDKDALIRNGQLTGIYALSADNKAILRWVLTGKEKEGSIEVLSGISDGEKYIVEPEGKLFNGAQVVVDQQRERISKTSK